MSEQTNKPEIIRAVLTVKKHTYLTPNYIRIVFTGDDVPKFAGTTVGVNNKIFIPPTGTNEIYFPEYDFETGEWKAVPVHLRPIVRTYTHRGIAVERKEMTIDFVAHGDGGPASAWAINAKPGDKLGIAMKAKATALFPEANWYLLVGDATGIPVIATILADLPASAKGIAYIEVQSKADEQELQTAASIKINWIHHDAPGKNTLLTNAVRATALPADGINTRFAYVAAEFTTVKDIRHFLRKEQQWKQDELYAYSYWKQGVNEDGSVKDRHQEQKGD